MLQASCSGVVFPSETPRGAPLCRVLPSTFLYFVCRFPGFKEVRMIESKPGISFVEFSDENQSTVAMSGLQGYRITPTNPMLITYAKK